jgi:hypothetical protein
MNLPIRTILLFLFFSTQAAMACKCASLPPTVKTDSDWLEWRLRGTSVVFEGKVESIHVINWPWNPVAGETIKKSGLKATFSAVHAYRGEAREEVVIETGLGGGDCGFDFEKGSSYLVFAWKDDDGNLTTNICSGTRLLEDAGQFLRLLSGKPALQEEAANLQPSNTQNKRNHQICGQISVAGKGEDDTGEIGAWELEDDLIAVFRAVTAEIKPDGRYCIDYLVPGEYIVFATQEKEGANQRRMAYYPGVLNRSEATPVVVTAESKIVHADFPLVLQNLLTVRGHLRGAANLQAQIVLMSSGPGPLSAIDPVEVGLDGLFEFDNVPPGRYTIFATKDNDDGSMMFLSNGVAVDVDRNIEGLKLIIQARNNCGGLSPATETLTGLTVMCHPARRKFAVQSPLRL